MRSETTGPRISHWHPYRRKCARLRIPGPITLRETGASILQIPIADYALPADGKIAVTERRRMPRLAAWRPDKQWRAAVMGWRRGYDNPGPGTGCGGALALGSTGRYPALPGQTETLTRDPAADDPGRGGCPAAAARGHHPRLDRG